MRVAWSKPFCDVESSYKLLVADLKIINENILNLHTHVGKPIQIKGMSAGSIWGALNTLAVAQAELEAASESMEDQLIIKITNHLDNHAPLQQTLHGLEHLEQLSSMLDTHLTSLENSLHVHGERFKHIKQVLQQIPNLMQQQPQASHLDTLDEKIYQFETQLSHTSTRQSNHVLHNNDSIEESLAMMQEEIRLLKQRVVQSGTTIGNLVFQSYEDFAIWVKTGVPTGRFGLFVDGHSLLDFFSFVGFLEAEAVAHSFHSSNKSGFKSMLETQVAASMQNFFPAPFGKVTGEKIEDSESLPGIPGPDKFDNGSTGVQCKILRGMKDISSQFESNIDKVLQDYPDARQMD
jgi:hypothetical protein